MIERGVDDRKEAHDLLAAIKASMPRLQELLAESSSHWGYEDPVYRFYHHSWKVFYLQSTTEKIVDALAALAPTRELNERFRAIVADGTGKEFAREDNQRWSEVTRPIVEAFFHARYFLEMAVKYGTELDNPPSLLPSGWASVLYLFNLR